MRTDQEDRSGQPFMGLLDHITATSLDEDYAEVAQRRGAAGESRNDRSGRRIPRGVAALAILAIFGLLVATAGIQTSREAPVREDSRASLIAQIKSRSAQLDDRRDKARSLSSAIDRLQKKFLSLTDQQRSIQSRLTRLGVLSGALPVRGPGVTVVVDDDPNATQQTNRVNDSDLQKLVNGLWVAGAEAISINGYRLTSLSPIRMAGSAITVSFKSLHRPYVVSAIGNPNQLQARFAESAGGSYWLLDAQTLYGLQFTMTPEESLKLPAASPFTLRHATPAQDLP